MWRRNVSNKEGDDFSVFRLSSNTTPGHFSNQKNIRAKKRAFSGQTYIQTEGKNLANHKL